MKEKPENKAIPAPSADIKQDDVTKPVPQVVNSGGGFGGDPGTKDGGNTGKVA